MKFTGIVVKGQKLGRKIGFPTINIEKISGSFPKKFGIYACKVGRYLGAMHYGPRPVLRDPTPVCEIHILNCKKNLYGKKVTVNVRHYLRPIKHFRSLHTLKSAILEDVNAVRTQKTHS